MTKIKHRDYNPARNKSTKKSDGIIMSDYKFEPHGPWLQGVYKTYCQKCGLVRLNNSLTAWAIKHGCNNTDHPNYEQARSKLGHK